MKTLFILSVNFLTLFSAKISQQLFITGALNFNTLFAQACHMVRFIFYQSDINFLFNDDCVFCQTNFCWRFFSNYWSQMIESLTHCLEMLYGRIQIWTNLTTISVKCHLCLFCIFTSERVGITSNHLLTDILLTVLCKHPKFGLTTKLYTHKPNICWILSNIL